MNDFARNVSTLFKSFYSKRILNRLARESGFVQRRDAKLTGFHLAVSMTLGGVSSESPSLSSLVNMLSGVVSRTSFHDRIDESAVEFMKRALEYTLEVIRRRRSSLSPGVFRRFNRVLVWDSSSWGVNEKLHKVFKGTGGSGSKAAVSLQYALDIKSSVLEFFDVTGGTTSDQNYRQQVVDSLGKRDLLLVDRGYFSTNLFQAIGERAAYYISRFTIGTTLYENGIKLNIYRLLKRYQTQSIFEFEAQLARRKLPCRIVCVKIPEMLVAKKLREMRKEARERGRKISKERLMIARWSVFITNVPRTKLSAAEVAQMYRLRWNIELVFRQLKSTFHIDKISHGNKSRLLCEIYGTLILAAISQRVHGVAQELAWRTKRQEISIEKVFKLVKQTAFIILQALTTVTHNITYILIKFAQSIKKQCIKIKQPSRTTSMQKVLLACQEKCSAFINSNEIIAFGAE